MSLRRKLKFTKSVSLYLYRASLKFEMQRLSIRDFINVVLERSKNALNVLSYIRCDACGNLRISFNQMKPSLKLGSNRRTLLVQQCRLTKVAPFDIPSQQCGHVCDQHDHTKFVFWFLSNISAQQICA